MKQYKQFFAGVVVGGLLLSGGNALANTDLVPTITNWVKYKINGEEKALPNGYTTLNYKGHTYVPTRFVAEQLGAKIEWDDKTKTVLIDQQPPVNEEKKEDSEDIKNGETKQEEPDNTDETDLSKYDELPVSKTINGVRLEVYDVEEGSGFTKFYLIVKNTQDTPVQLQQGTGYFQSESTKYKYTNAEMSGRLYWKDNAWFRDIEEDQDQQGYVMLPSIPDDEKYGKFYIEVTENTLNGETMKYEFDIKW